MTHQQFLAEFPKYQDGYQPNPEVITQMGRLIVLITIGPSGVGKSTIMKRLSIPFIPSEVSREKRDHEIDGVDYNFRTDLAKLLDEIKTGQLVQFAAGPNGEFYGTKASSYPAEGLATMAVMAEALDVYRGLPFKDTISVFITPGSWEQWMNQLGARHLTDEKLRGRLKEGRISLELSLEDPLVHFILNQNLDEAVEQINQLLDGQIDEAKEGTAKEVAKELLANLASAR